MNKLQNTMDYVVLFALVGGLGAIGGVANELLQTYRGHIGLIRFIHLERRAHRIDLGVVASVLLGTVAALVVLLFFPLEQSAGAQAGSTRAYDLVRIIPLSLLAGVGGSAVLSAAKARLLAVLSTQQVNQVEKAGKQALDNFGARSEQLVQDRVRAAIESEIKPKLEELLASNRRHVPGQLYDELKDNSDFSNKRLEALTRNAYVDVGTEITPHLEPILTSLTDEVMRTVQQSLQQEVELGKKTISAVASAPESSV